jgi:hypothetical protein
MAHDSEHLKKLTAARDRIVAERRQIVDALALEYKSGHTGETRERFISIQSTIEAIDRAIADEGRIASGDNSVPPVPPIIATAPHE